MNPEERFERIERQIEFLADHQAAMSAAIDRHSEQIGQLGGQIGQLADFLLRTGHFVEDFTRRTEERFNQVADAMQGTNERIDRLAEAQRQLTEAQHRTDERLNVLINVVERYFSGNGRK